MRRKLLTGAVCAATLAGLSAGPALAGEITGSGELLHIGYAEDGHAVLHGASLCAFSGLNDDQAPTPAVAQSYGQIVKVLGPLPFGPGTECNPTRNGAMPEPASE
jgi:hypothetical protein